MELVSAIITTCKRNSETVLRAVKSVVNQTYKNIEILVIDDSPSDYSGRDEVRETITNLGQVIDKKLLYIRHEKCVGACAARNTGLRHSKGVYIGYLDDDDEWLPCKVARMVEAFTGPDVALVYCDNERVFEETGETELIERAKHRGKVFDSLILTNYIGSTSFPLMRRDALESIGGFDEQLESAQDYDVWLRLSSSYEVNYVEDSLVRYYIHKGDQISKKPDRSINGLKRLYIKNEDYLKTHSYAFWKCNIRLIPFYIRKGDRKTALSLWKKCVCKCPGEIDTNVKYMIKILFRYA